MATTTTCPNGHTDSVRKVSRVTAGDTQVVHYNREIDDGEYRYTHAEVAYAQTPLAQSLNPPSEPQPESVSGWWYIAPIFLGHISFLWAWFAPISVFTKALYGLALSLMLAGYLLYQRDSNREFLILFAIGAGLMVFVVILFYVNLYRAGKKRKKDLLISEKYKAWQKAYQKWELLWYCDRCDIVFIPGHEEIIQRDRKQLETFLYQ